MEIYLIRHTTPNIEKGICYGQSDLDLVANFSKEFEMVKTKILNSKDFKVISSPLKRCALLAKKIGDKVVYDDRLKELNFGDWELKAWNDIPQKDIKPWMEDFVNVAVPNGESYIQLALRVNAFFDELINSDENQNIIIVTHAGTIRALLASLKNIPLEKSFRIKIDYGEVFHLKKKNGAIKLVSEINL